MTELPTTFGKYYLTEKLATGGMAEIFLGKIIGPGGFEKQLVIKQIHPALTGQRHFVDLFVAEAKTLVGLAHGNIVPLYELGVIDDTYFIAMEYIDGPTLWRLSEAMARRGQAFDPGLALYVGAELAKGLDYAHRKGAGIIHRDLSPRNVMLSRDGEVKLVDFGIAVAFGGGETPADEGMPTGSFPYMSPEQVARRPLTGQSDLFSLGVLLWEMLVGERLFARDTPEETLAAVAGAEVAPPSARRRMSPEVPETVDAIVLKCLERDEARRWNDAGELSSALSRALYAMDPVPGARDVAAIVARYCPPLGRDDVERSAPRDEGGSTEATPRPATDDGDADGDGDGAPSTKVMERAKGKRKPTIREATFATSIDFERVLSRATPLVPLRAIVDDEPKTTPTAATSASTSPSTTASSSTTTKPPATRAWLVLALVVVGLAAAAIWWLAKGGTPEAVMVDAAVSVDAPATDASLPDAPAIDAPAPEVDARAPVNDARAPDAGARASVDAGVVAKATGRLKVGAVPWGEVYLDGKKLPGQAPRTWDVPAGPHRIEIVFPATEDEPEIRKRFDVVVPEDGEEIVSADFSR